MKLLFVEDDQTTADYVMRGLSEEGHSVDHFASGKEALTQAMNTAYDVLIIDRMLPDLDGLSLIKSLRSAKIRIDGLRAGGDDYLVKPFAFGELSARVAALGRRLPMAATVDTVLKAGDLEMDLVARTVTRSGQNIDLLPREFSLLEHLLRRKGRVQTRTMLLEGVWNIHFDPQTNVVETHISRLRSKVDKPFNRDLILTVRGSGYKIDG